MSAQLEAGAARGSLDTLASAAYFAESGAHSTALQPVGMQDPGEQAALGAAGAPASANVADDVTVPPPKAWADVIQTISCLATEWKQKHSTAKKQAALVAVVLFTEPAPKGTSVDLVDIATVSPELCTHGCIGSH